MSTTQLTKKYIIKCNIKLQISSDLHRPRKQNECLSRYERLLLALKDFVCPCDACPKKFARKPWKMFTKTQLTRSVARSEPQTL